MEKSISPVPNRKTTPGYEFTAKLMIVVINLDTLSKQAFVANHNRRH